MARSIDEVNIDNFEALWNEISEKQKVTFLESSILLGPNHAIAPVLKGLDSHQFAVRTQARKTFKIIQSKLHSMLGDPSDQEQYLNGMKASAEVCSYIFPRFTFGISLEEQRNYFKIMLMLEGNGAHFALKTVYMNLVKISVVEKTVLNMPEVYRLRFIGEYMRATPGIRLKFGEPFRRMIKSIKDRKAVVKFYAGLFDTNQDADPILYNIAPELRDPRQIISQYVQSKSPVIINRGLKALAMTTPKISIDLMLGILRKEKDPVVRKTLYKIIENSTLGSYPEMFYPIMELLEKSDVQESVYAFKAMIVSGKLPLYELLDLIKEKHPTLMGHIYKEIAKLSKISFFFIQDIALNRELYLKSHMEINLAAAFGMIKKRPERVVTIIKHHIDKSEIQIQKGLSQFVKKADQLLNKEKLSIVKKFKRIAQKIEKKPEKQDGLFDAIFSSLPKKKINMLMKAQQNGPINFQGAPINDIDLSSISYTRAALYFNHSTISNCTFSKTTFLNACFKKSILYKINMQNATFDSVNFSGAIFINVNAEGAVFKNCNFQNISAFNCKFNHAQMQGASLISTTVSNCTFLGTDLSGASFAYSDISVVSFIDSVLNQADFTAIRARFCRFPSHARAALSYDNIDLNARKYQLEPEDIPELDDRLLSQTDMLILGEFIHYGEMKFFRQNKRSQLTALDIFNPRQSDLFQMIPYLLHKNVMLKGIKQKLHPDTPYGVHDYYPDSETLGIISKYSIGKRPVGSKGIAIEGVFTIGSIGSVAQTDDSDIDYWICIREDRLSANKIKLLEKKLQILERYAQQEFRIQVTFFIVDVNRAKNNDFGSSSFESSGSAQSLLLKEEFYRTMIHVAGKIPLWAVLPTAICKEYYERIFKLISSFPNLSRYIDLGDINAIPPGEFFGATIWQLFKSLKSPFKSIIKMASLEKSINESGKKPLLCNLVKDEWMNSGLNLRLAQNDAYYILLKHLLSYYNDAGDKNSVLLLLTCFYLKLGISKETEIENTIFGLRKSLLEKCIEEWNFSKENMFAAGKFKTWPYQKVATLSATLESYMINKYKIVNKAFDKADKKGVQISPEDRTVLGRKVFSELSKQSGKIQKVLLVSASHTFFYGLHLKNIQGSGKWELLSKRTKGQGTQDRMIEAETIEEISAWLILNQIYDPSGIINLIPNPTPVNADDLKKLFTTMHKFFSPVLKIPISFQQLLDKEIISHLFVSINFYAPKQQKNITDCTAIYFSSWGKMFSKSFPLTQSLSNRIEVMAHVLKKLSIHTQPESTVCYLNGKLIQT